MKIGNKFDTRAYTGQDRSQAQWTRWRQNKPLQRDSFQAVPVERGIRQPYQFADSVPFRGKGKK